MLKQEQYMIFQLNCSNVQGIAGGTGEQSLYINWITSKKLRTVQLIDRLL